jgi:hypothetical protein
VRKKHLYLPVVLYGCKTWSLTLREEDGLRVFENRVLRIFGLKGDEGIRYKVLRNEELPNSYTLPNRTVKSKKMRWAEHVAHMEAKRNAHRVLMRKPEGMEPLGVLKHKWDCNIKIYIREIEWGDMDWTHLAQDKDQWWALLNTVTDLRVP